MAIIKFASINQKKISPMFNLNLYLTHINQILILMIMLMFLAII